MAADFYGAILGLAVALLSTLMTESLRGPALRSAGSNGTFEKQPISFKWPAIAAGIVLASLIILFNAIFW